MSERRGSQRRIAGTGDQGRLDGPDRRTYPSDRRGRRQGPRDRRTPQEAEPVARHLSVADALVVEQYAEMVSPLNPDGAGSLRKTAARIRATLRASPPGDAKLREALEEIRDMAGKCLIRAEHSAEYEEGSNRAFEQAAEIARTALEAQEDR